MPPDARSHDVAKKPHSFLASNAETVRIPPSITSNRPEQVHDGAPEPLGNRGSPGLKRGPWGNGPNRSPARHSEPHRGEPKKRIILVKARSVSLLMAAAFACFALSPVAAADDPVVARVNGVEIKQ